MKIAAKVLISIIGLSIVVLFAQSKASSAPVKQEASQEKWEDYATDEDGASYSYNAGNVERLKNNNAKVWVQTIYSEKNPKYVEGRFQWEIDCSKKKMRGLKAYATKKDGKSTTIKEASAWSDIPAGSTAETLHEKVCKKNP